MKKLSTITMLMLKNKYIINNVLNLQIRKKRQYLTNNLRVLIIPISSYYINPHTAL